MKELRLREILPSLIAARAWAPWAVAPRHTEELRMLQRRVVVARLGDGGHYPPARRQMFDDVQ